MEVNFSIHGAGNGKLVIWGWPVSDIPFIFGDLRNPNHLTIS